MSQTVLGSMVAAVFSFSERYGVTTSGNDWDNLTQFLRQCGGSGGAAPVNGRVFPQIFGNWTENLFSLDHLQQ